ncbi:TIC chloroplastic [Chlorella sorokiniana]|uniref:TIC chloroplastic n=1 Tax=Chlorella sorokiniana TaxID=3076 RepID=A0A2P6TSK5_CHLSO|nr:TIC chloroplastic [Chlorella sorokiniana]|eukprot:PRW57034.1 TIC chloroplastic [Chlorella sorokiniana]
MLSITPTAARVGSVAPRLAGPQRQQAAAASQARVATQKQAVSGGQGIAQRRARAAAAGRRLAAATVAAKAGGDVLVVGSSGQTAARVVVSLLRTGFKVTAGVDTDLEESQEVVKFAKQLEILNKGEAGSLKLAEFNPLDAESIAGVLKRGSRVVLVVGDQAGSRRPDLRIYDAVLEALLENAGRIAQLVVVTPLGGGGGGGFFGGGGGASGGRLSNLERRVVESGVDYLVVRAAPSDRVTDRYGEQANVVVAPVGRLPGNLQASRAQVAAVVAEAMAQAKGDAIIEVAASPAAPDAPLRSQVAAALAGAQLEVEEEEEEEEEAAPAPAKRGGFFTIGGGRKPALKAAVVVEEEEEEEEEEAPAPAKKPAFGFGGFGTRKITARQQVVVEEEEEEEEEEAPAPAPAPKKGFFTLGSRKAAPAPVVEEEEEEEEEAPAPAPKRGGFAFGSRRGGAAVAVAEPEAEAPPATRRIVRGRNPVAAPEEPKARPAPAQQQQKKEEGAAPKKSGGFLGFLGISNETVYADE